MEEDFLVKKKMEGDPKLEETGLATTQLAGETVEKNSPNFERMEPGLLTEDSDTGSSLENHEKSPLSKKLQSDFLAEEPSADFKMEERSDVGQISSAPLVDSEKMETEEEISVVFSSPPIASNESVQSFSAPLLQMADSQSENGDNLGKLTIDEGSLVSRPSQQIISGSSSQTKNASDNHSPLTSPMEVSASPLAPKKSTKGIKKTSSIIKTPAISAKKKKEASSGEAEPNSKSPELYEVGKYPMHHLVRDAFLVEKSPKAVCSLCLNTKFEPEDDPHLLKCSGDCKKNFHSQCLSLKGLPDVVDKVVDASEKFKCQECSSGMRICFSCKQPASDLVNCPDKDCGQFYHHACLMGPNVPLTKKLTRCQLHHCHTCARLGREPKSKDLDKNSLAMCSQCPKAHHFNFMCFPAEARICPENAKFMTCWKHFSQPLPRSGKPTSVKKSAPWKRTIINPTICFFCKKGGELLVCDTCPFTAHCECAGLDDVPEGPWKCADCTKDAKPMLLDIVWFKPTRSRIWPCQIVPEQLCPSNVLKHQLPDTSFILRYLGTQEYAFGISSQVLPYETYDPKWKRNPSKELHFLDGLKEAKKLAKELLELKTTFISKHFEGIRPVYQRIKSNKPIPPVKYITSVKKEDAHICVCTADDTDPCGPTSNCLNRGMEYECHPKYCPTGDKCKNQRIRNKEYPKLEVFYTANRGWALKVKQDVKEGDLVIEYVGEIITVEERNRRIRDKLATGDVNFYFLDLTNARVIDAGPAGNLARFANHSCDANSFSQKWDVDGDTHIALIATRDINRGDEITFDYRWEYEFGVTSRECLCGADICPGMIGGKTYDPSAGKQVPSVTKKVKRTSISPSRKRIRKSTSSAKMANPASVAAV